MTTPAAFKSFYNDFAYGASIEGGTDLTKWDTLKAAFFYRRDIHTEYEDMYSNAKASTRPAISVGNPKQTRQSRRSVLHGGALRGADVDRHTGHLLGCA